MRQAVKRLGARHFTMANDGGTTLRIAIGDYPHTLPLKRGQIASPSLKLARAALVS